MMKGYRWQSNVKQEWDERVTIWEQQKQMRSNEQTYFLTQEAKLLFILLASNLFGLRAFLIDDRYVN